MINRLLLHRGRILVISIGLVSLWFGMLKFFPGLSPAESLAKETLEILTLGLIPSHVPFHTTWAHETVDHTIRHRHFYALGNLADITSYLSL